MEPNLEHHKGVLQKIAPHINHTPVFTSRQLNEEIGAQIYFKGEHLQRMGAFKMRGATYAASQLSEDNRAHGLCTHSSGNHGQAVALAAKSFGVPAYIAVPHNAPKSKVDAMIAYGAELTFCDPTVEARESAAQSIVEKTGAHFIHPSNDSDVIWGQGTAVLELLEEHPDIDTILVAVGGGGLLAGSCLAAKAFNPNIEIYAAEPDTADDAYESLEVGHIVPPKKSNTIADGLRTGLGDINFSVIKSYTSGIFRVSDEEIEHAMKWTWERMKQVIEPSAAVPLAAIRRYAPEFKGRRIGIILCGGNVNLSTES